MGRRADDLTLALYSVDGDDGHGVAIAIFCVLCVAVPVDDHSG